MVEEAVVQETGEKELAVEEQDGLETSAQAEGSDAAAVLKTELEQVRGERDQLLDRLARLQAEFENTRRREVKERQDLRDYAVQNAVEPFLGVMDNFQLALKSDGTAEQLRAGVELILKQMEEALKRVECAAGGDGGDAVRPASPRGAGQHRNDGVSGPPGAGRDSAGVQDSREAAAAGAGEDCGE
jgi:molecular chaperone GrpE (heat shock protein)